MPTPDGRDELPYHGDVVFYEQLKAATRGHDGRGWVQYRARFTEGHCVWIKRDDSDDR